MGEDLIQEDAEGPDVRLGGVQVVNECFWSRPFDGKFIIRAPEVKFLLPDK